jgi:hypothetical protein
MDDCSKVTEPFEARLAMPFCPICRCEYEAGVAVCADCDEALVAVLPPPDVDEDELIPPEEMVPLARLTSHDLAEMLLEALHHENIPAFLHSEAGFFGETGQMGVSSYQAAGGGYVLLVHQDFVELADTIGAGMLGDEWDGCRLVDTEE